MLMPFTFTRMGGAVFDPEAGLTLTNSFDFDSVIGSSDVLRTNDVVFACDILGLTTAAGLIHEQGAIGRGSYIGFNDNNELYARFGDGSSLPNDNTANGTASGVSGSGTLVWTFEVATIRLRVWWNGALVIENTAAGSNSDWAGGNEGNYFRQSSNVTDNGFTDAGSSAVATSASALRYYENQTV